MTKQKTFKRQVRTRMEKTSESYTAARRQLLAQAERRQAQTGPVVPQEAVAPKKPSPPVDTGVSEKRVSDEALMEKTGRNWESWFTLLDQWGAQTSKHSEIARWLSAEHGVAGWWAQNITVAYERARNLRVPGQKRDGAYSVSASKTVNTALENLYAAVEDPAMRARWLVGDLLQVTTASPHKSIRGRWGEGQSRIAIGFVAKGDSKSQIAVAHEKLADAETARESKVYWAERLKELKQLLEN
ncbi:MAG TPA: DUF4287 domain-containing protein [Actinomycetota bacterium]|nr:DUF4287 domain-containing protein [Actinomycetota bacterium]